MRRYTVRLRVECLEPPTAQTLANLRGGRWEISATRRSGTVSVSMFMDAGDAAGAVTRSMNLVLDQVPGEVVHVETDKVADVIPAPRRRRRSPKR